MKASTTSASKRFFTGILIFIFWIVLWQILSWVISKEILLPSPVATVKALAVSCHDPMFYKAVLLSVIRILLGYCSGLFVGITGAVLSCRIHLFSAVFSPIIKLIRAVPVASFIILAFVWFKSESLPVFITFLMVVPMVWSTVQSALENIDYKYIELAKLYRFSNLRSFFSVKLPLIAPEVISVSLTALGFAWKSGIAAEVICRPAASIGNMLQEAKLYINMPEVFALTAVVAILSMLLEIAVKHIVRRYGYDKA